MNRVLMVSAALVALVPNIHEHQGNLNCLFVSPDKEPEKTVYGKRYWVKRDRGGRERMGFGRGGLPSSITENSW